ncbi:NUDIX hydrolase [Nakamurella aerolata]|uniref:NUDIX hydrolase n=1 Tax=Nakamurella aerolata TaxID=1656892 RepID=UPI001BB24F70
MSQPDLRSDAAGTRLPGAAAAPDFVRPLLAAVDRPLPGPLGRLTGRQPVATAQDDPDDSAVSEPPAESAAEQSRPAAVLILLAADPEPQVLLTARASTLRSHAGQPAFPGGRADPGETPVQTALREAEEETGLDPAQVQPIALLRPLPLSFSGHLVTPVLAVQQHPAAVRVVDPAETSAVAWVPVGELTDPANRGWVGLSGGYRGPAFSAAGLVVWGFTGLLLDAVLTMAGWNVPWLPGRALTLPSADAGARPAADAGARPAVQTQQS